MFKDVYDIISDQEGNTIDVSSKDSKNAFIAKHNDVVFDPLGSDKVLVAFLPKATYEEGIEGKFNDCLEDDSKYYCIREIINVLYNSINTRLAYLSVFPEYVKKYNISKTDPTVVLFKDTKEICRFTFDQFEDGLTVSEIISKFNEF